MYYWARLKYPENTVRRVQVSSKKKKNFSNMVEK
jgi:hypothetical protein